MKCLAALFVLAVITVYVSGEKCMVADDCVLETCASGGVVCDAHHTCTCAGGSGPSACDSCNVGQRCEEHGHGHHDHKEWHCLDGQCQCVIV